MHFAPQSRREPSIRLFRSDFLEWFSHVHPAVVVVVWLPAIGWFLWQGLGGGLPAAGVAAAFTAGVLVWTFTEYVLHRFVFHFAPADPPAWLRQLVFLFHGIHHVQPWDKTRLVMPPAVSVPLAFAFHALFALVLVDGCGAPALLAPTFAGFLAGYLAYDLLHYAVHHLALPTRPLKWLKRHHLLHHHDTPDQRYGVSTPLWDAVFGTLPDDAAASRRVAVGPDQS